MKLTIEKIGETLYQGEAYSVTCPGVAGDFTLLSHHAPLVSALKNGVIMVRESKESEPKYFETKGGVVETANNSASILL